MHNKVLNNNKFSIIGKNIFYYSLYRLVET
jgi:hypothetical protein